MLKDLLQRALGSKRLDESNPVLSQTKKPLMMQNQPSQQRNPINVGRLESMGGQSPDNVATNRMVDRGQLPMNRAEIYPQQLRVQQNRGLQPQFAQYEDEFAPADAIENTGYFNPQTTQTGQFRQPGGYNPQTSVDGSLYDTLRLRLGL